MHFTVYAALWGWIPLVILLFANLPARKALLIGMIGGWLFLPVYYVKLKAFPEYSKLTAASIGCLLGTILFDWKRIFSFRLKWFDLPMLVWCMTPYITSIENDLGWYDGVSAVIQNSAIWGIPYFLGRIYFPDWTSFRELGLAILVGGLIYVPLCLLEIRLSPQLHHTLYGFYQHDFNQTKRLGGYRPMVFLQHGLAVGMWMTSASLVGLWFWQTNSVKRLFGIPMSVLVPLLLVTTLLCKSTGGLLFLAAGIAILYSIKYTGTPILLLLVMASAPAYMYMRASGQWSGEWLLQNATKYAGEERAQSLLTRVRAENLLSQHALEQPYFGWGRWNRNRVMDASGKDMAPTDGLWVLALGETGIVGLIAFTTAILLPPLLVWWRCPLKMWEHPGVAAAVAMAVLLSLYMLDNILNAMPDPIFTMALGGLAGIAPSIRKQLKTMPTATLAPPAAGYAPTSTPLRPPIATFR